MIAWLIIYIIGVVLVGGVSVWYIKEADEDDYNVFLSWLTVLFFVLTVAGLWIDEQCGKVIIKKGKKEEEE